ncbi:Myosin regulatory light chain 2, smooth muscle minor isoform [Liparis tanakae]|uniref:Myosin regulatory light chain 2, smooth muscle minor isoform n=1 Tax=Liparis tanakae TaxID=230148 RepID=A0A4Z2INN5_9TELE|nr:Myosin regulatory light chain 2, smooth muscle minor isoform [Liparis tanakae]
MAKPVRVQAHSERGATDANMSSKRAKGKNTKKRPQRATSNVFAMFDQSQIQEFKEAFNMIDQNRDGKNPTDDYLETMMSEAPGPVNFTMFLTMFGEKLNGTDPEDVIRNAFACFDEEGTGIIQEEYLRELLTTMGDRFTDDEVDELFREAPIDKKGNFNYVAFTRILKHGAKDKDD